MDKRISVFDEHDFILQHLKDSKMDCEIFLTTGVKIDGKIESYDRFTITVRMKDAATLSLWWKSGLCGIIPAAMNNMPAIPQMKQ
jgi:RNA chaperone Hfq